MISDLMPLLLKDGYKVDHRSQYPKGTEYVYSNLTARKSRIEDADGVIFFGLQYFIMEFLQRQFDSNFFYRSKGSVVAEYKEVIDSYLGPDAITYDHIAALHDLGYLPLKIKAVPEGTLVPFNVPMLTIINTQPQFFWLTNMLETLLSSVLWKMTTSATTAFQFRRTFQTFADLTSDSGFLVPWQGHDFSFRGMSGPEDAARSGAAHLLSFTGTDSIPAIPFLKEYYAGEGLIGGSVPATEHSVMCMGQECNELDTFRRIITEVYPKGIVSIVSDTWDYWKVLTEIMPALRDEIMARDGKLVVRPDSGNPTAIICGAWRLVGGGTAVSATNTPEDRGTIQCLYDTFGGTVNSKGFIELDPHVGCIYGDSINLDKQMAILRGLEAKGFASTNIVMGIGSYTYQYTTRDTYGFAVKATWGQQNGMPVDIYKDPATDRAVGGSKKSHKGLLAVYTDVATGKLICKEQCTYDEANAGWLQPVFEDGKLLRTQTLAEIRASIDKQVEAKVLVGA